MSTGRLKAIVLREQETHATRNATAQRHVPEPRLLHVARPRECNTQQWASYREKKAELARLVALVEMQHGFGPNELLEDLARSDKDVDYWLVEFKLLSAEIHAVAEPARDGRIMCHQCAELAGSGRCQAAKDGRIKGALRDYSPVQNVPLRCECFKPKQGRDYASAQR